MQDRYKRIGQHTKDAFRFFDWSAVKQFEGGYGSNDIVPVAIVLCARIARQEPVQYEVLIYSAYNDAHVETNE